MVPTDPQLSEVIRGYEAALLPLALRLRGRDGADLDDLLQEGRISIWAAVRRGRVPNLDVAFHRMQDWVRHIRLQNPAPYEDMLELGELDR